MADKKRRILIVDDDMARYHDVESMFKNCGVEVEVGYATCTQDALKILDNWLQSGHKPNIITADDNTCGSGEIGLDVLTDLLSHCEHTGTQYLPDTFFIHSRDTDCQPALKWGTPQYTQTQEFECIAIWQKKEEREKILKEYENYLFLHTTLRRYCNRHWGTHFIVSKDAYTLTQSPETKFPPQTIHKIVANGNATQEQGLSCFDPSNRKLIEKNYISSVPYIEELIFKEGTGSPVSGRLALSKSDIDDLKRKSQNEPIIFCTHDYTPEMSTFFRNIDGFILIGKANNHLALQAENADITAIMGLDPESNGHISLKDNQLLHTYYFHNLETGDNDQQLKKLSIGDYVTIDSGNIISSIGGVFISEQCEISNYSLQDEYWYSDFMDWADTARKTHTPLSILANADTSEQVQKAFEHGAEGIGLLRTEHLLSSNTKGLEALQSLMTEIDETHRKSALNILNDIQEKILQKIFTDANNTPVTVRLLDAVPDEILDNTHTFRQDLDTDQRRGVQFASQTSGLYEMQIASLFNAAAKAKYTAPVKILVPLVRMVDEFLEVKATAQKIADNRAYKIGAMIETLDAVDNIREIAQQADFISIGTNDLMSEIMGGIERHDGKTITDWMITHKVTGQSPFQHITSILEEIIKKIVTQARNANPYIEISICGRHMGTDYRASEMAIKLELDSLSVPPKFLDQTRANAGHYAIG